MPRYAKILETSHPVGEVIAVCEAQNEAQARRKFGLHPATAARQTCDVMPLSEAKKLGAEGAEDYK